MIFFYEVVAILKCRQFFIVIRSIVRFTELQMFESIAIGDGLQVIIKSDSENKNHDVRCRQVIIVTGKAEFERFNARHKCRVPCVVSSS